MLINDAAIPARPFYDASFASGIGHDNLSLPRQMGTQDSPEERGLTRAGLAHQGNDLTSDNLQIDIVQDVIVSKTVRYIPTFKHNIML